SPKWRKIAALTLLNFAFIECFRITADNGSHDRVIRLISLNQAKAFAPRAPRPSCYLIKQLKSTFSCAWITIGKTKIRIHYSHKRHIWKVMPFRNKLCANYNIGLALGDSIQFQSQPFDPARNIRRKHDDSGIFKSGRDLFSNALDTRPTSYQMIQRAAFGTCFGHWLMVTTLMAHKLIAKPMLDQPA